MILVKFREAFEKAFMATSIFYVQAHEYFNLR